MSPAEAGAFGWQIVVPLVAYVMFVAVILVGLAVLSEVRR